jgi:hypothetical protein
MAATHPVGVLLPVRRLADVRQPRRALEELLRLVRCAQSPGELAPYVQGHPGQERALREIRQLEGAAQHAEPLVQRAGDDRVPGVRLRAGGPEDVIAEPLGDLDRTARRLDPRFDP